MKKLFFIFALALSLVACVDQVTPTRPDDVLDRETFTNLMVEVQLIEAMYNRKLAEDEDVAVRDAIYPFYAASFEKFGTNQEQFSRSFEWYSSNPQEMKLVYEEVENQLSLMEEE